MDYEGRVGVRVAKDIMRTEILGRICWFCKKEIGKYKQSTSKYCSVNCMRKGNGDRNEYWDASRKADKGAMSELLAAADLLKKGFEVYRNVSPCGSVDLIIRKGQTLLSVEVRTARRDTKSNKVYCPRKNIRSDILALVFKDIISYEPELHDSVPDATGHS